MSRYLHDCPYRLCVLLRRVLIVALLAKKCPLNLLCSQIRNHVLLFAVQQARCTSPLSSEGRVSCSLAPVSGAVVRPHPLICVGGRATTYPAV